MYLDKIQTLHFNQQHGESDEKSLECIGSLAGLYHMKIINNLIVLYFMHCNQSKVPIYSNLKIFLSLPQCCWLQ